MGYEIVKLSQNKEMAEKAAKWFSSKWDIPYETYLKSIEESFDAVVPSWYICMDGKNIVAGMGVIENDFHDHKDLTPNVCAVFTEPKYRKQGICRTLMYHVCEDMHNNGINTLYLVTNHIDLYEHFDWKFLCMVNCEDGQSRMYVHEG